MLSNVLEAFVLVVYGGSLLFLFVYSISQLHLTWAYLKKPKVTIPSGENQESFAPFVTVQLPVYNEANVVARLIKQTAAISYPRDLFEIQILDDSDDDTSRVIRETIAELDSDIQIHHIQRTERTGFKAGALKYGMKSIKGELIAIFDADFLPEMDFLEKTVAEFKNPKIGVVQTRWGHLNKEYSVLTKAQAFGLDAHFTVEQLGRNNEKCFISFNGTAGIWRKTCIEDAGGWQSDTLTEDLDLSYRAQLKGWEFVFMEDVVSPAELPITMSAFKSQQYRWNKGAAETHLKIWREVWNSSLEPKVKFHAMIQLLKGFGFVASFLLTIVSVPMLYYRTISSPAASLMLQVFSFTLVCVLILTAFYYVSLTRIEPEKRTRLKYFFTRFPGFIAISMATSLHNTVAVMEGYLGIKTPFIRTPKFNVLDQGKAKRAFAISVKDVSWLTLFEGLLAIYFLLAAAMGIFNSVYSFVPFHLLMFTGYLFMFLYAFRSNEPTVA